MSIPQLRGDVPFREREGSFARALLAVNGVQADDAALPALMAGENELLAAAAARLAGMRGLTTALPRLRELAASPDDLLAVHAAAGLAYIDPAAGREALRRIAAMPFRGAPGAIQAAGELARLGDPSAAPTVYEALESDNPALAAIAAKQLVFLADAGAVGARPRIVALLDDPDLAFVAIDQLAALDDAGRELLRATARHEGRDPGVAAAAAAALQPWSTGPEPPRG